MSANAGLDWRTRLLELLPNLRAFANSLCRMLIMPMILSNKHC